MKRDNIRIDKMKSDQLKSVKKNKERKTKNKDIEKYQKRYDIINKKWDKG